MGKIVRRLVFILTFLFNTPSARTVQAPHCPGSQPFFVPVRLRRSRNTSSNFDCITGLHHRFEYNIVRCKVFLEVFVALFKKEILGIAIVYRDNPPGDMRRANSATPNSVVQGAMIGSASTGVFSFTKRLSETSRPGSRRLRPLDKRCFEGRLRREEAHAAHSGPPTQSRQPSDCTLRKPPKQLPFLRAVHEPLCW